MKTNEKTSKRVSAIAGRVLEALKSLPDYQQFAVSKDAGFVEFNGKRSALYAADWLKTVCTVGDLKALAASCLTQAPDRWPSTTNALLQSLAYTQPVKAKRILICGLCLKPYDASKFSVHDCKPPVKAKKKRKK